MVGYPADRHSGIARCSLAGVVNSISQACGKLSFNIASHLYTQKEGRRSTRLYCSAVGSRVISLIISAAVLNTALPYHDLPALSRSFKDNLANRLLCKLLEGNRETIRHRPHRNFHPLSQSRVSGRVPHSSGYPTRLKYVGASAIFTVSMPACVQLRVAKYLPLRSILALQATCRDIHNTLNDNLLWHDLCVRDFEKAGKHLLVSAHRHPHVARRLALVSIPSSPDTVTNGKNWFKLYRIMHAQKQPIPRHQFKSSSFFHPTLFSFFPPNHPTPRLLFPDTSPAFHPFSPAIYRPMPPGIFRKSHLARSIRPNRSLEGICTANTPPAQSPQQPAAPAQHHIYCQPCFGLKWVVIFAGTDNQPRTPLRSCSILAATMIPVPPCLHPVWLG